MTGIFNLDLISVGVAVASIGILGFMVFFNNKKSITNITFLLLAIAVIAWGVANYVFYKLTFSPSALVFLRLEMFFAVWFCFFHFPIALRLS